MGGFFTGIGGLILLDLVLARAPSQFARNAVGPVTVWLDHWMDPDRPLIRPGPPGLNISGGWATTGRRKHPPPVFGPAGRRPL